MADLNALQATTTSVKCNDNTNNKWREINKRPKNVQVHKHKEMTAVLIRDTHPNQNTRQTTLH